MALEKMFFLNIILMSLVDRLYNRSHTLHRAMVALKITEVEQMLAIIGSDECHFVYPAKNRKGNMVLPVHMSGTQDSRRFIHVYLYWISLFGVNYPLGDFLLRKWKYLKSTCGCGYYDTRGHPPSSEKVCINPKHYELLPSADEEGLIRRELTEFIEDVKDICPYFVEILKSLMSPNVNIYVVLEFVKHECPKIAKLTMKRCAIIALKAPPPPLPIDSGAEGYMDE